MQITLHKFQEQAILSDKQVIVNAAGIQSGKTTTGAVFMGFKAATGQRGDNLIICAPTYKILTQATLPKFLLYFENTYGTYRKVDSVFEFYNGVKAYIRSLTDPNALEGTTDVIGIWADEAGLFSKYAWENVMGRAAFRQAQVMVTTTPYSLNWMFRMWEDWKKGKRDDVEFIQYRSIDNPYFPKAEFERQKKLLDPRRFKMKYMGEFGKMEGLVYEDVNVTEHFPLPTGTKYYGGIDWGYTNPFVLSIRAITPDNIHYRVAEFYKTRMTIEDMIEVCRARKQIYNIELFIADPSAPGNIESFNRAGLSCVGGNNNVRLGIDKQIELFRTNRFFIFKDQNPNGIDEYSTYHFPEEKDYKIDDNIKDLDPVKANDHGCFIGETLVATSRGMLRIDAICVGDEVLTPLGYSKVTACGLTGFRETVKVSTSSGHSVECTSDHPFLQFRKSFTPIDLHGSIPICVGMKYNILIIGSIVGTVNILSLVAVAKDSIEQFIVSTTGIFQRVSMSTILMGIRETMTSLICSVFQLKTTKLNTTQTIEREGWLRRTLNTFLRSASCRKSGIGQRRGESGIDSMASKPWQIDLREKKNAFFANLNLKLSRRKPSIARTIVSLLLDVEMAWIMWSRNAPFARWISRKIGILRFEPVRVDVQESCNPGQKVYNLTTELGCYYANGFLVSNCDADRYVTMYLEQKLTRRQVSLPSHEKPQDPLKQIEWLKRGGSSR